MRTFISRVFIIGFMLSISLAASAHAQIKMEDDNILGTGVGGAAAHQMSSVGEAYSDPSFRELAQTFMMLGGIDIKENSAIDEYGKLIYCDLYREKFKNEFEWYNIRTSIASRITQKKEYYRIQYQIRSDIYLGRYSMETQDFPFVEDSALINVSKITIVDGKLADAAAKRKLLNKMTPEMINNSPLICDDKQPSLYFPMAYSLKLLQPLTFDRLKLPPEQAEKLTARMKLMRNDKRKLYARIRFRLSGIEPGIAGTRVSNSTKMFIQSTFRGYLTAIDVFLDPEMTQHVASIPINPEDR